MPERASDPAEPAPPDLLPHALLVLSCLAWLAALFAYLAAVPFLSEDACYLEASANFSHWTDAFHAPVPPPRPLHHLFFWLLAQLSDPTPALARAPAFLMHACSCLFVHRLARQLGAGARGASAAALLFLLFPNVTYLAYPAAISGPGRTLAALGCLTSFLRFARTRSALAGVATLAWLAVALLFHQWSAILPFLLALAAVLVLREPGSGRAGAFRVLRSWPLAASFACLALFLLFLLTAPTSPYQQPALGALPGKVVRAAYALGPEPLRAFVVGAFRGSPREAGFAVAAAVTLALGLLAAICFRRGTPVTRFLLLAAAVDLAVPVLVTGFSQRYAYLAAALAAVAAGVALGRSTSDRARGALATIGCLSLLLLAGAWARDTWGDAAEHRAAGLEARRIFDSARELRRAAGPKREIVLLNLPRHAGGDREIDLLGAGFPETMTREGVPGRWVTLWPHPSFPVTEGLPFTAEERRDVLERHPGSMVLELDHAARVLVPVAP